MPMYNLIEYALNYTMKSGSLWQCFSDEPAVNNNGAFADFNGDNDTISFKIKVKITGQTRDDRTKDAEIMVPLK